MHDDQIKAPVLLLIFNRADTTNQVFQRIRNARPHKLYISADGPREWNAEDKEKVLAAREVTSEIDWPCQVKRLYRDYNLGCKSAVSEGISWFFSFEESGIILEDDCLPDQSFFEYCQNMLTRYANHDRVFSVAGQSYLNDSSLNQMIYFSRYPHCWGWATWRRAWAVYDGNLESWPELYKSDRFKALVPTRIERKFWNNIFSLVRAGKINSWAYAWTASIWDSSGLTVTPCVNLVSNIGFSSDATHTTSTDSSLANLKSYSFLDCDSKLIPWRVTHDLEKDQIIFDEIYGGKKLKFPYFLFYRMKSILGFFLRFLIR